MRCFTCLPCHCESICKIKKKITLLSDKFCKLHYEKVIFEVMTLDLYTNSRNGNPSAYYFLGEERMPAPRWGAGIRLWREWQHLQQENSAIHCFAFQGLLRKQDEDIVNLQHPRRYQWTVVGFVFPPRANEPQLLSDGIATNHHTPVVAINQHFILKVNFISVMSNKLKLYLEVQNRHIDKCKGPVRKRFAG